MSGGVEVRSFRVCFDLERRIHRIDRWRLPVPWGVPLRGVAYALGALTVVLAASELPGLGVVVGSLPAPLRLVLIPVGAAVVLARWRLDGRPAHRAVFAVARQWLGPRRLQGYRRQRTSGAAHYAPLALARDLPSGGLERARVVGPARLSIRGSSGVSRRRGRLVARAGDPEAVVSVDVADGEELEVRP